MLIADPVIFFHLDSRVAVFLMVTMKLPSTWRHALYWLFFETKHEPCLRISPVLNLHLVTLIEMVIPVCPPIPPPPIGGFGGFGPGFGPGLGPGLGGLTPGPGLVGVTFGGFPPGPGLGVGRGLGLPGPGLPGPGLGGLM